MTDFSSKIEQMRYLSSKMQQTRKCAPDRTEKQKKTKRFARTLNWSIWDEWFPKIIQCCFAISWCLSTVGSSIYLHNQPVHQPGQSTVDFPWIFQVYPESLIAIVSGVPFDYIAGEPGPVAGQGDIVDFNAEIRVQHGWTPWRFGDSTACLKIQ